MAPPLAAHFDRATELFDAATSVAAIGHIRPDADAIGSMCAVIGAARQLSKAAVGLIGQEHEFAASLRTIPGAEHITVGTTLPEAELYVVVDCGALGRAGALSDALARTTKPIIVVDHHDSNIGFGTCNLIDHAAESTTTVLWQWFGAMGLKVEPRIAHALYAGLVTDTGNFRWGRPMMHEMAADLVHRGIDTRAINAELVDCSSLAGLRMRGKALSRIEVRAMGRWRLAVLCAAYEDIAGLDTSEVESLVDFVRGVEDADLGVVFKEYQPGWFAVSLRAIADIDVSAIAAQLGGGGHLRASGYTCDGTLEENLTRLSDVLSRLN